MYAFVEEQEVESEWGLEGPPLLYVGRPDTTQTSKDPATVALPYDVLVIIMVFSPLKDFEQVASVCRGWAAAACQAKERKRLAAATLLAEGLGLMETAMCSEASTRRLAQAVDVYPRCPEASFWLAKSQLSLGQTSDAAQSLEAALRFSPAAASRAKLEAFLSYVAGDSLKARVLFKAAQQMAPADPIIHFELGYCYHGAQKFEKAVRHYSLALEHGYTRKFVLLGNRANCLLHLQRHEDALADLDTSLAISPNHTLALRTRASVYMRLARPQAAHADYTSLVRNAVAPRAASDAFFCRAACFGRMDEADLDLAIHADPSNLAPVRAKAYLLASQQRHAEALDHLTSWIEANDSHEHWAFQVAFRAELLEQLHLRDAAARDYRRAVKALQGKPPTLKYGGLGAPAALARYHRRLDTLTTPPQLDLPRAV